MWWRGRWAEGPSARPAPAGGARSLGSGPLAGDGLLSVCSGKKTNCRFRREDAFSVLCSLGHVLGHTCGTNPARFGLAHVGVGTLWAKSRAREHIGLSANVY